jgi:RNA polymerase sigma-70 factor (ECF subfamily)
MMRSAVTSKESRVTVVAEGGPSVEAGNERDRVLIGAIASGDRAAFEEIHSRYSSRIRAFALQRTRRRDLAEELTCETLTTIWLSAARFRHASKVSTWIFGIARILSLRALRRVGSVASTAADSQVEEFHNPWSNDELCEWLDAALALLPEEQRTALELCYRHGHSCQQIADRVGCPLSTVKTRMFHGRRKLRKLLPKLANGRNS